MPKIVFIGDSITKGVGYGGVTAADTFAQKIGVANGYDVIMNKGVSSDTSAGVLARLQADVLDEEPAVCVLMIGANDWQNSVPLATYKSNLTAISQAVSGAGIKLVHMTSNMQRGSVTVIKSFETYVRASEEMDCDARVDVWREMILRGFTEDHAQYYADAIHPNVAGHAYIASLAARPKHAGVFLP